MPIEKVNRNARIFTTVFTNDLTTVPRTQPEFYLAERKFANAGPLGLCAFAGTLMLISLVNLNAAGVGTHSIAIGMGECEARLF
jgi:succinate-acetate transporter protein